MTAEAMMDSEVANPLRMLSAYLMTTAMTSPPTACVESVKMTINNIYE